MSIFKELKKYNKLLQDVQMAEDIYKRDKEKVRRYSKYENQLKSYKDSNSDYELPITMMKPEELRKVFIESCIQSKKWLKKCHKELSEFQKYILEEVYDKVSADVL